MLEHGAAIQLNLAPSRQEVTPKQQYDIWLLFKIKHSHQHTNLKKETNTSSPANPSVESTLCCCFYNTYTYNCSREWLWDYRGNSCWPYCTLADSKRNRWGLLDSRAKPGRSRKAADLVESWDETKFTFTFTSTGKTFCSLYSITFPSKSNLFLLALQRKIVK